MQYPGPAKKQDFGFPSGLTAQMNDRDLSIIVGEKERVVVMATDKPFEAADRPYDRLLQAMTKESQNKNGRSQPLREIIGVRNNRCQICFRRGEKI
jgi:hypothetical protein